MPLRDTSAASCVHCPLGKAGGVGRRGLCPFEPRRHRDGARLCSAGEPAATMWYVKRGLVALSRREAACREVGHLVVHSGGLVGAEALHLPTYRDSARTLGAATVCAASRGAVDAWLGPRGTPARVVLALLVETRVAAAPRSSAIDADAITRVARWLGEAAVGDVVPAIERRFVASLLGMRPETMSRALGRLVAIGAVDRAGRAIRIVDQERLGRLGRGEPGLRVVS